MWLAIILLITLIIVSVVYLCSKLGEDRFIRVSCGIGLIISSLILGIIIALSNTPTIEDYVNGKVETEIVTTVKDGKIIKCDTLYYKRNSNWDK